MIRKVIVGLGLALLVGCSTTPIDIDRGPRAEEGAIIDPALRNASQDSGVIRIARDAGFYGSGASIYIYLDGKYAAVSEANRVLVLHVPAGPRKLGYQVGELHRPVEYQDLTIQSGETYDFRLSMSGGETKLQRLN